LSHAGLRGRHPRDDRPRWCRSDSRHHGRQLSGSQSCRARCRRAARANWTHGRRKREPRSPPCARAAVDDHGFNAEAAIGGRERSDRRRTRSRGLAAARGRHDQADRLQDLPAGRGGRRASSDGVERARRQDRADNVVSGFSGRIIEGLTDPFVGRTIAQYDILARVGGGAMGVVYRARDTRLGRPVALKFLPQQWSHDETAKQRFVREAQAASATHHPNICTIHDIETADDGQLFIVMALYEGLTLKQRLERGPLALEEALEIATQIADGLAKAHGQGVVHRDIKPGNVMLTEDGVRILDFGLATFADALKLTSDNASFGTPAYMSPEQVRGQAADARTDVWAAGVVLYEMLAGHVPFQGSHAEAIAHAVRHEAPATLRSTRPE